MYTKSLIRELEGLGLRLAGTTPGGWFYRTWDGLVLYVCRL